MINKIKKFIYTHPVGKLFVLGTAARGEGPSAKKDVVWKKVSDLKTGAKIATVKDEKVDWDEVVSIKKVGRRQVYDVEVEGTHNFVGNDIVAHNTNATNPTVLSETPTPTPTQTPNTIPPNEELFSWISSTLRYIVNMVFEKPVEFLSRATFRTQVVFDKQPEYNDTDTAGEAIIRAGHTSVRINFVSQMVTKPIVQLTPLGQGLVNGGYYVSDDSASGFTISLSGPAAGDVRFNWSAIKVNSPRSVESSAPQEVGAQVPTSAPSASPTTTQAPSAIETATPTAAPTAAVTVAPTETPTTTPAPIATVTDTPAVEPSATPTP